MEIRIADNNDIDELMRIRIEMLRVVNNKSDDYEFSNELIEHSRNYFLNGDQTTVLALDNGRAVGCASVSYIDIMPTFSHPTGRRGHIMNVYTHADYRRQGIARKMLDMLIEDAKSKEATELSLDATEQGRPLYETMGFETSSEYMVKLINE